VDRRLVGGFAEWGEFLDDEVSPGAAERDAAARPIERELLQRAAAKGILAASLPSGLGGGGLQTSEWGTALEAIGYRCDDGSFSLLVSLYAGVANAVAGSGRDDLIDRYIGPFISGDCLLSFAYTENADPFSFASTLRDDGQEIVVNAEKRMITGGQQADGFVVYARDERTGDLGVVIVERDDPGVRVEPVSVMGVRAAGLARLEVSDARVPAWRALQRGGGLTHVQRFLNRRRILLCCAPLGRMGRLLEGVIDDVTGRIRHGRRVADLQNVQATIGRMHVQLAVARQTVYSALEAAQAASPDDTWTPAIAVAKYTVTESALSIVQSALRITGGNGYTAEGRIERDVRDFHGLLAGAGAQDILEVDLGANAISARERQRRFEA
jgi:alkylation response protein AidB-like acyl-CoA dehydrogenase